MKLLTAHDLGKIHRCQAQTIRKRARLRGIESPQKVGRQQVWWDTDADRFAPGPHGWNMRAGLKKKPKRSKKR